ncbi:MAG: type II secretion system protein [Deltaproteobacteria bacterium]|nr:type II secretion system protein [Deltaproteobacteria bacterium]
MRHSGKHDRGFTLIEIVAVLIVIGIIGTAVTISSVYSTSANNLAAQVEVIKGHLRYAQARAMSSDAIWGINFSSDTYFLFKNGNINDTVFLPAETSDSVTLPAGMTITVATVSFDSWGKPYTDAAATAQGGADISVSLGGTSETISITNNTGFIP